MIEGPVLLREALEVGFRVREVFIRADQVDDVMSMCEPFTRAESSVAATLNDLPMFFVLDEKTFNGLSDVVSPRGVMAVCDIPATVSLDSIDGWVLVAHDVSDPGNVGTLMRSVEASGASALVISGEAADPFAPKTVRSSAGAVMHVPIIEVDSIDQIAASGFDIIGTTSHDSPVGPDPTTAVKSMYEASFEGRVAVVMGNEARGLSSDLPIDRWVTVPHRGRSESLNVAMAGTALAMHIAHVRSLE